MNASKDLGIQTLIFGFVILNRLVLTNVLILRTIISWSVILVYILLQVLSMDAQFLI